MSKGLHFLKEFEQSIEQLSNMKSSENFHNSLAQLKDKEYSKKMRIRTYNFPCVTNITNKEHAMEGVGGNRQRFT